MTEDNRILDRALLARRRRRALESAGMDSRADFLLREAAEETAARLSAVNRRFRLALDLGGHGGLVTTTLRALPNVERVVRADSLVADLAAGPPDLVVDEEALPFAPESFDLVVSLLGLQSVNDLPGAIAQIRRILQPDGLFLAAILAGDTLAELSDSLLSAEAELTGGASPRVLPFATLHSLAALLQRAGLALPVADLDRLTVRYGSLPALMRDLRAMAGTNALVRRSRRPASRALFRRAAEIYAERHADPDGRLRATFQIVYLSGWAPHESQQQPLRPGSARMRLADALGTAEQRLGDDAQKSGPERH